MAASEHTPHMQLSQFGPDDRPSWIDDYNADMRTLDTAVSDVQNKLSSVSGGGGVDMQYYQGDSSFHILQFNADAVQPVDMQLPRLKKSVGEECTTVNSSGRLVINRNGVYLIDCNFNFSGFSGEAAESFAITTQTSPAYDGFVYGCFLMMSPSAHTACRAGTIVLAVDTAPMEVYFQIAPMEQAQSAREVLYDMTSCVVMRVSKQNAISPPKPEA